MVKIGEEASPGLSKGEVKLRMREPTTPASRKLLAPPLKTGGECVTQPNARKSSVIFKELMGSPAIAGFIYHDRISIGHCGFRNCHNLCPFVLPKGNL